MCSDPAAPTHSCLLRGEGSFISGSGNVFFPIVCAVYSRSTTFIVKIVCIVLFVFLLAFVFHLLIIFWC